MAGSKPTGEPQMAALPSPEVAGHDPLAKEKGATMMAAPAEEVAQVAEEVPATRDLKEAPKRNVWVAWATCSIGILRIILPRSASSCESSMVSC